MHWLVNTKMQYIGQYKHLKYIPATVRQRGQTEQNMHVLKCINFTNDAISSISFSRMTGYLGRFPNSLRSIEPQEQTHALLAHD